MTRGALPRFGVSLARGATGSCMGLEGTWGPVLHPSPPELDGTWPRLGAHDKGCAPTVRLPLGTWVVGVMHGVRGHMGARIASLPPLEWIEYGPAREPTTRGTWHPFPLSHRQLPLLTHACLWLLVCNPLTPLAP